MGLFSGVGKILNGVTGVSSSAAKAQQYALKQMAVSNQYQKEFAQNAHQWEMADLKKAGINPSLGYSLGGASAGGSGGTASGPTGTSAGMSITDIANSAMDMYTQAKTLENQTDLTKSQIQNTDADTARKLLENENLSKYLDKETKARLANIIADTTLKNENTAKARQGWKGSMMGTESLDSPIGFLGSIFNGKKDKRKVIKK